MSKLGITAVNIVIYFFYSIHHWILIFFSLTEIVQPLFDLHVGYEIMTLRMKIFQPPLDDTLIILMDNVTIDVTRYENESCYNINGKCHKGVCSCYMTNNTFTSMYRKNIGFHKNGGAVGIEYRFYGIDGSIFKVISFRTFESACEFTIRMFKH